MAKFEEAKRGYNKEQVDAYIKLIATEYEKVVEENKDLEEKIDEVQGDTSHSEAIAAALINAELAAKQVITKAHVEANCIVATANQEVEEITSKRDVALEEVRQIVERLQLALSENKT